MATWPSTLPQALQFDGYQDKEPDLVVREQMDQGPPIVRQICTANVRPFEGEMVISLAQKVTLRAFYLANCALPFDFPDPDTGAVISVMFADKPSYSSFAPGYQKVALKLEEQP